MVQKGQENLAKQVRITNQQAKTIDELQKKIEAYNNAQKELLEKNRFKAGGYMQEINQREEELGRMRASVMSMQDELKLLTVSREQYRQQVEIMSSQINDKDRELESLKKKIKDQNRILDSMVVANKNLSVTNQLENQGNDEAMEKTRDDIERAERIARNTNKSIFMNLGEKQPKLVFEENILNQSFGSGAQKYTNVEDPTKGALIDDTYLFDDSIPAEIYPLIQKYREKLQKTKNIQTQLLALDDFFAEIHKIMKDVQMKEIARIRNEHSVEIMKMRKNLEKQIRSEGSKSLSRPSVALGTKENLQSLQKDKFLENEIERQRRALLEENELLKKRLRAAETIIQSGNQERTKFMEGASWIAKKAHVETEKHILKIQNLLGEYQRRCQDYMIDESISEVNGREVLKVNRWIVDQVEKTIVEVGERFESIFENVNYHLKEATKNFTKYK